MCKFSHSSPAPPPSPQEIKLFLILSLADHRATRVVHSTQLNPKSYLGYLMLPPTTPQLCERELSRREGSQSFLRGKRAFTGKM